MGKPPKVSASGFTRETSLEGNGAPDATPADLIRADANRVLHEPKLLALAKVAHAGRAHPTFAFCARFVLAERHGATHTLRYYSGLYYDP